jgi:hypothetical protein
MSDFFTGYNPTIENRDEIANTATPVLFSISDVQAPEEIDPRPLVRHDDQGNMGSCGGFGSTNNGEGLWGLVTGSMSNERQFSQLYAYLEAQRLDGLLGSDKGSTISSGLKVAKAGYLELKHLPYQTPYPRNARTLITDEMRAIANRPQGFRIRSHAWLESYDDIFKYLASQAGTVYPGTPWNDSFYGRNGVLESVSFTSRDGGHAYAFLGYSKRVDRLGRNYLWRLNSHRNDSWTEVAPSVIDQLCRHQWSSIVGMSDLLTPGPNRVLWKEARPLG